MASGDSAVTVIIDGNASGLQSAVDTARAALQELGVRIQETGDTSAAAGEEMNAWGMIFGGLGGTIGGVADRVGAFATQTLAMFAAMAGFQVFNDAADAVRNLGDELFNLSVQTEKNVYGWQYLFGGGAAGKAQAAQLAQWTSQESMNVPFTRQDLMGATSTLGAKFNAQQIEQYMPTIADYASTLGATAYGGQGVTLQEAARAITELMMGRSQMFKMDFNVDPELLIKYGLDAKANSAGAVHIQDMSTLLPALQAYAHARGISGAAKGTSQQTWWGEWSSFQDRVQNFLLSAGGTNSDGSIRSGSLFASLKSDLNGISSWMDAHQDQISRLADIIGKDLGGALQTAASNARDLFSGLQQSGLLEGLGLMPVAPTSGQHASEYNGRPVRGAHEQFGADQQQAPSSGWAAAGQTIGNALQTIGNDAKIASQDIQTLTGWISDNHDKILIAAGAITAFYTPALVKAGVQAIISGGQITYSFIASLIQTGVEGWTAAGKLTASFIAAIIDTGGEAVANAAKVTATFIASLIQTGAEAVANAAKVTATFVASLIQTGAEAVANGAKIVAGFVASLIKAGVEAAITGATMLADLVPAIIATTIDFIIMAGTAIIDATVAFIAYIPVALAAAAATIAATWPILLIIGGVALLAFGIYELITHWKDVTAALGNFKNAAGDFLGGVGKALGDFFSGLGTWVHKSLDKLGQIKDSLVSWAKDLAKDALQWGIDLVQNLINGIGSKITDVKNAAGNVAGAIGGFLHHTTPAEGPLHGDDQWGTEMALNLANGMRSGLPQIAAASQALAAQIAGPLTGNGAAAGGSGAGAGAAAGSSVSTSYGDSIANVNIHGATDGRIETVAKRLLAARDSAGNLAMRRPGNYGQFGWIG